MTNWPTRSTEYTKLGRTGLDVSRIHLGCMSYGGGNLGNHARSLASIAAISPRVGAISTTRVSLRSAEPLYEPGVLARRKRDSRPSGFDECGRTIHLAEQDTTSDRGAMARPDRNTVIFDLGGVLIEWDPRHLYRKLFGGDDAAMEEFLASVCTHEWNRAQDAGRSFAEGARLLKARHPNKVELIDAYHARFDEMMPGPIEGSLAILAELRARGTPLYALSNFSAETYPSTFARFEFLRWFRGIVVSGEVRAIKPEPEIYRALIETYAIDPHRAVFIDDVAVNVAAALAFGIHAIRFTTPDALRAELLVLGLLD